MVEYDIYFKKRVMSIKYLIGVVVVICLATVTTGQSNRVKFHDLGQQTFRLGYMTNARRSSPIPQITCISGYGKPDCSKGPSEITCSIVEKFGNSDAIWKCTSVLGSAYKISKYDVSCEGYDYPDDPYILDKSCGVEYVLDLTPEGERLLREANAREAEYKQRLSKYYQANEESRYNNVNGLNNKNNIYDEAQRRADKTGKPQIVVEETIQRVPINYKVSEFDRSVAKFIMIVSAIVFTFAIIGMCVDSYNNSSYESKTNNRPDTPDTIDTNEDDFDIDNKVRRRKVNNNQPTVTHTTIYNNSPPQPVYRPKVFEAPPPIYVPPPVYVSPPPPIYVPPPVYTPNPVVETRTVKTTIINPQTTVTKPPTPPPAINTDGEYRTTSGFGGTKKR